MVTVSASSDIARAYLALQRHDLTKALAILRSEDAPHVVTAASAVTVAPVSRKLHASIVSAFEIVAGDDEGEPSDEDYANMLAFALRVYARWPITADVVELALWDVGEDATRASRIHDLAREMWIDGAQ